MNLTALKQIPRSLPVIAWAQRLSGVLPHPASGLRIVVVTVNALLVVALAHALAAVTLTVLTGSASLPSATTTSAPGVTVNGDRAAHQPSADVAAIQAWHLFGQVKAHQPVPAPPPVIPVTPLNLRLVGIFFAERGSHRALALIAEGNNLERGYRIGEMLPGSARLERIERDQVVVSRNGREEVLKLPKLDDPNRPATAPSSLPISPPAPEMPVEEPAGEAAPTSLNTPPAIDASAIAARLRGEVAQRPQALEDVAFASPYVQSGQFVGFRLRPGRNRQLFQQLGLNGGDVLTEINGTRLSSPTQGLAVLQELMSASRIDLRVLRNGAEIPLAFTLDGS